MKASAISILFFVLVSSSLAQTGLTLGETAPAFTVKNQKGETLELNKILAKGPVVLVFYRGQWCPYCNKQLSAMQDSLGQITGKHATVIAISPEKPESVTKTIVKTKASFNMVSDQGLVVMKKYKVDFELDGKSKLSYKFAGVNVAKNNGENGAILPVPATYVIATNGKISYVYFNQDYRKRPSVKTILEALK